MPLLNGSVLYLRPDEAVQLCLSQRFCGAYLYYAAAEALHEQIGAAAMIKYRITTGAFEQPAITET